MEKKFLFYYLVLIQSFAKLLKSIFLRCIRLLFHPESNTYQAKGKINSCMNCLKADTDIVPVYKYFCYISSYDKNAALLHEINKQRSTSETWIEQVKGQAMAGATLTDDFWANDNLWQLGVFTYNLSVMMR